MRHRLLVRFCFLVVSFADLSMALSFNESSPPQSPLYGIDPPSGWRDFTFFGVPPAAGTVSISILACADLNANNESVHINVLGGRVLGNLFKGDSGTGCSGDCDTEHVTMTADEWNAARSSSAGGVGGVEFEATPSSGVTNICCSDTCSSSGPGGSSECCANQCSPIPCFTGSITFSVSYVEAECATNGDCDDGNACTTDTCIGGSCSNANAPFGTACGDPTDHACTNPDTCNGTGSCGSNDEPNGTSCPDGVFCNGDETCQNGVCTSGSDPCEPLGCHEVNDVCTGACTNVSDCDDGNECTDEDCVSEICEYTTLPNGTPCSTGLWCSNGNDFCNGGVCVGHGSRCPSGQFCNETVDSCDPDSADICKGETRTTVCQQFCLSDPPETTLRRFGADGCPHNWVFDNVPYVDTSVHLRTFAFGHFGNASGKTYGISLQGIGTVVSGLYYDHTSNCMTGTGINRFLDISPEDWNAAVDETLVSGPGNVRFDMTAVGVPCIACGTGQNVNSGVFLEVTFLAGSDDCNDNGREDSCDIDDLTSLDENENGIPDECECSNASIVVAIPPDCTLDARQPHPYGDNALNVRQGIGSPNAYTGGPEPITIDIGLPGLALMACWGLSETDIEEVQMETPELDPNRILSVTEGSPGMYDILLERPISAGQWTTITYLGVSGSSFVSYASVPADSSADGLAHQGMEGDCDSDVWQWIYCCFQQQTCDPPAGNYTCDINRDGPWNFNDLGRLADLLQGFGTYIVWEGKMLPSSNTCPTTTCPSMMSGGTLAGTAELENPSDRFLTYLTTTTVPPGRSKEDLFMVIRVLTTLYANSLPMDEKVTLAERLQDLTLTFQTKFVADMIPDIAAELRK